MRQGLGLRQIQTLKLAPQLIQSLKMLQMPLLKLEQTLRQELATNPLLEEAEEFEAEQDMELEAPGDSDSDGDSDNKFDDIEWDQFFDEDDNYGYKVNETRSEREDGFLATASSELTLYDHLHEQLSFLRLSPEEHKIGEYILGNINPSGYLVVSAAEMAEEIKLPRQNVEAVLEMIRGFDPVGVGSRDLRESLLRQLEEKELKESLAYRIVKDHLYDLERKSILQISKMMGVPFEKAQASMDVIKSLSPTPAHGRFESGASTIIPDLIVERIGDDFVVFHNDRSIPRLRINPAYRSLARRGKGASSPDTKKYISQKLEQARWLINSINQRRNTMVRVMESVIDRQRDFFERGTEFLKPLIMEDIARIVDMNVATISRVSNGKYVQTPHGVFEIKYFFNTGISKTDGGELSKRHVKRQIEEIIAGENPEKPYSDQEIYRRLKDDGIQMARRTVTKYREELKILPARFRRRTV